jgi:hypothetical protein
VLAVGAVGGESGDREWLVEKRYRAVLEVLDGSPVGEVAVRYGVSRQTVHAWKAQVHGGRDRGAARGVTSTQDQPDRVESAVEARWCVRCGEPIHAEARGGLRSHLWQRDLVGRVFLADGRECKMLTGIDDHSRFVMVAAVLAVPSGAVADAFLKAMRADDLPSEVLTDNGKQFTGRFTKLRPAGVLFERVCRENGHH